MKTKGDISIIGIFVVIVVVFLLALFMAYTVNQGRAGAKQGECVRLCEDKDYTWDSNTKKICVCNINTTHKEEFPI